MKNVIILLERTIEQRELIKENLLKDNQLSDVAEYDVLTNELVDAISILKAGNKQVT